MEAHIKIDSPLKRIPPVGTVVYGDRNGRPSERSDSINRNQKVDAANSRNNLHDSVVPHYRIMIVDDEVDIVGILKKGLLRKGFHTVGYTNPIEALSSFAQHRYDVILIDIRMPQMNGIELFRQLRAIDKEVLICFLTAYEQFRQDFEIAHPEEQVGCFIPKSISIDGLVSTIIRKIEEKENDWRKKI